MRHIEFVPKFESKTKIFLSESSKTFLFTQQLFMVSVPIFNFL